MKKVISFLMSVVMLLSITTGLNLTVNAQDYSSAATDLPLNGQWSCDYWITATNKEHWYRITIESDGYLEFRLRSYSRARLVFYNDDLSKQLIGDFGFDVSGTEASPSTSTYGISLSAGTYYAKVFGDAGRYNLYALYTSYGVNDNDAVSFDSPQDLAQNYEIVGAITATDTEDWFKIEVPTDTRYIFKLTSYTYNRVNLFNYDLSIKLIGDFAFDAEGSETAPDTSIYNIALSMGTYYIRVFGDQGKYLLSWYELTPENCSHEYETEKVNPTCTEQGYTLHKCNICGYTYKNDYIDAKGHDFGNNLKKCSTCGAVNPNYVAPTTISPTTTAALTVSPTTKAVSKPKGAKFKKVKGSKKAIVLTWAKVKGVKGYQIQVATDKKFKKNKKTVTIKKQKTTKTTVKKLKSKKKYFVRIRTYKTVNGKKIYSSWSKAKTVKTK